MITGSEEESRALMMNAAIRILVQYGLEGFTTKKWAAEAGVSEGSLYYHFKSKSELLEDTFYSISQGIADLYKECSPIPQGASAEEIREAMGSIWRTFYRYMIKHPEETIFYYRFRTSPRCTAEVREKQLQLFCEQPVFRELPASFAGKIGLRTASDVLQNFLTEAAFSAVFRVVTGEIAAGENTEAQLETLLLDGILGS